MKTILFPILLIACLQLAAQKTGYIIDSDNQTIDIYKSPNKKRMLSKIENDCDCQKLPSKLIYNTKDGEVVRMKNEEITKIVLHKGTRYCADYTQNSSMGSPNTSGVVKVELPEELELLSLPVKKNGSRKVLQSVIVSSPDYLMTIYNSKELSQYLFIYDISNNRLVESKLNYLTVGIGKPGLKTLETIKSYFKECEEFIEQVDKAMAYNESVKKRMRMPVLLNATGTKCE